MIVGIGTDIMSVDHVAGMLERRGEAFAKRLLADEEWLDYSATNYQAAFLAKRFAVKEAAAKALGTGFAEGVTWRQIFIEHDPKGKPELVLKDAALERARALGVVGSHVSISDEKAYAVAFVVLERS